MTTDTLELAREDAFKNITEFRVYDALARDGPLSTTDLAERIPRAPRTIRKTVADLDDRNLVERDWSDTEHKTPHYRLACR